LLYFKFERTCVRVGKIALSATGRYQFNLKITCNDRKEQEEEKEKRRRERKGERGKEKEEKISTARRKLKSLKLLGVIACRY
jgi:hypothetical protein